MTTEHGFISLTQPSLDGPIQTFRRDSPVHGLRAEVRLGRDAGMQIRTPAKARELLAAAFESVRILDPDGPPVIARSSNGELFAVAEILAADEQEYLPGGSEPAPFTSPDLVIPPAAQAEGLPASGPRGDKGGYSPPGRVYDLGRLPNAPAGPAPGAGAR